MSTVRCQCRRKAETSLRCVRCSVAICPDCSVIFPAGMLCKDCGSSRRSPLQQVETKDLLRAYLVCLPSAAFGGWLLANVGYSFGLFGGILTFLYGLGVGEIGLRVTGYKRGLRMEIMAGVCVVFGLIDGVIIEMLKGAHFGRGYPLTMLLLSPWTYVVIALAIYGAVSRIRNV